MNYYWIKLKTDFFENDAIDFLLEQTNGSDYVALYLKLCTMVANTNGQLLKQIGEMIIPYDVKRIARDTKFFSEDTVIVALELYKKLGLIYQHEDGVLEIVNFNNMIGSEKDGEHYKKLGAERQRRFRERKKQALLESKNEGNCESNVTSNVTDNVTVTDESNVTDNVTVTQNSDVTDNVTITSHRNVDIRDKSLEIRDNNINSINTKERGNNINNIGVTSSVTHNDNSSLKNQKDHARSYGKYKNVTFKNSELDELKNKYGDTLDEHINILDEYIERTGKKYNSCYLAMKKWVHKAYLEHLAESENEEVQLDSKFYEKKEDKTSEEIQAESKRLREALANNQL